MKQGHVAQALARYDAAVQADPTCAPAHLNRGNVLQASARFDEARRAYHLAIACDPQYVAAHFNLGNLNYRAGEFAQALRNYQAAIGLRPQFADACIGMANALLGLGRAAEAAAGYRQALTIDPRHAEAHFNLGVLAAGEGRHREAAASLGRAIELRPERAPAHRMLGAVLGRLGDIEGAEASLRRAAAIEPDSAEILCELATILQYRGRYGEAARLLARALPQAPGWKTKVAFAQCAANTRFTVNDPQVRAALTTALTEGWGMPHHLSRSALSLLMLDERLAGCVRRANESWPVRPPRAVLFGADGLAALAAAPLLHALLDAAPVMSIEFERFLSCARHALLEIALSPQAPEPADVSAMQFYARWRGSAGSTSTSLTAPAPSSSLRPAAATGCWRCSTPALPYRPSCCWPWRAISRFTNCATQVACWRPASRTRLGKCCGNSSASRWRNRRCGRGSAP